jgi:hypothetical protein
MVPKVKIWSSRLDEAVTERHRYAAYVAFEAILGWEFEWCLKTEWNGSEGALMLQYGGLKSDVPPGVLWIPDAGLLHSSGWDSLDWIWSDASLTPGHIRLPFGVKLDGQEGAESDWLSWVFWMASRMEECAPNHNDLRDELGRFKGTESWAHQEGWLQHPILEKCVRAWAQQVAPTLPIPGGYRVQPTIDVDSAFAYRYKGLKLTLGAAVNDLIRGRWSRFAERPLVLLGWKQDPYDTYQWLEKAHEKAGLRAQYFFLLSNRGKRDRGVPWHAPKLQQGIRGLSASADLGIHPGFSAHDAIDDAAMQEEIGRLSGILEAPIERSRQHYLLQRFPLSWRRLERLGIKADHSLGYADVVGFRAGMSRPFRAYDIGEERIMDLVLHPIAAMDATLMRYLKLSPKGALQVIRQLSSNVREVEGVLVLLWHNESVSDRWQWKGWKVFYQEVLAVVVLEKNGITLES